MIWYEVASRKVRFPFLNKVTLYRDPRYHAVSIFYKVTVPPDAKPIPGDDAATAKFYDLEKMQKEKDKFAFDHFEVLEKLYKDIVGKRA